MFVVTIYQLQAAFTKQETATSKGNAMNTSEHPTATSNLKSSHDLRISLMGSEGSGKTCFFAGLAWLGSATQKGDFGIVGRDMDSQRFINDLRDTIARHEVPPPSFATNELSLDVIYRNDRIEIGNIEDFAGEEFRVVGYEIRTDSPLFKKIRESRYLVLFLDIERDIEGNASESAERLDAVLNLLSMRELGDAPRKLAVVLTKSDLRGFVGANATSSAARAYLAEHKRGLYEKIGRLGYEKQFFFLAPLGRPSLADGAPPSPFGYEALFSWLADGLRRERIWKWIHRHMVSLCAAAAIGILAASVGVSCLCKRMEANRILENNDRHTDKQIQYAMFWASQHAKDNYVDKRIEAIRKEMKTIDSLGGLNEIQNTVDELKKVLVTGGIKTRLTNFEEDLRNKREDIHLDRILAKGQNSKTIRDAVDAYYSDTGINHRRNDEVRHVLSCLDSEEEASKRAEIRKAVVISDKLDTLKNRCDLIGTFPFSDEKAKEEAVRAVEVARLFISNSPYHVEIKSVKGLAKSHKTRLEFSNLGPKSPVQKNETSYDESREPQWNTPFDLKWQPGDRIKINLIKKGLVWGSSVIDTCESGHPWTSLLDVLGGVELNKGNRAMITCKEFPDPKEDKRLFELYITPGTYWGD